MPTCLRRASRTPLNIVPTWKVNFVRSIAAYEDCIETTAVGAQSDGKIAYFMGLQDSIEKWLSQNIPVSSSYILSVRISNPFREQKRHFSVILKK